MASNTAWDFKNVMSEAQHDSSRELRIARCVDSKLSKETLERDKHDSIVWDD